MRRLFLVLFVLSLCFFCSFTFAKTSTGTLYDELFQNTSSGDYIAKARKTNGSMQWFKSSDLKPLAEKKGTSLSLLPRGLPSLSLSKVNGTVARRAALTVAKRKGIQLLPFGNYIDILYDFAKLYKQGLLQNDPALKNPLDQVLGRSPIANIEDLFDGALIKTECGLKQVVRIDRNDADFCHYDDQPIRKVDCVLIFLYIKAPKDVCDYYDGNGKHISSHIQTTYVLGDPPAEENPYPEDLNKEQVKNLVNLLERILENNDENAQKLADALDNILKNNPDKVDFDPLSNQEIKDGQLQSSIDESQQELEQNPEDQKAQQELEEANKAQNEEELGKFESPDVPDVELKSIDLQPIVDLKDKALHKFPFNLIKLISSSFDLLDVDPKAPDFDINLGISSIRVKFSALDSFAALVRSIFSFLCLVLTGFACLRIWNK